MNNPQVSNCCQKPFTSVSGGEGTGYYQCSECKHACDPFVEDTDVTRKAEQQANKKGYKEGYDQGFAEGYNEGVDNLKAGITHK